MNQPANDAKRVPLTLPTATEWWPYLQQGAGHPGSVGRNLPQRRGDR